MKKNDAYTLMFQAVCDYCKAPEQQAITDSIPAFGDGIEELAAKNDKIRKLQAKQQQNIKGFASGKRVTRSMLCDKSASILGPVYAYCIKMQNMPLAEKFNLTNWQLKKIAAEELPARMNSLHGLIVPMVPQLTEFNITAPLLTEWAEMIDIMTKKNPEPNVAIGIRKNETSTVKMLVQETAKWCDNYLDRIAEAYIETYPEFYRQYHNMRRLKEYGNTHTLLRINVVMGDSTDPVYGAVVSAEGSDETGKTDLAGECNLHVQFGVRRITVKAEGYNTYTSGELEFKKGKRVTLSNVGLVPVNLNLETPAPGATPTANAAEKAVQGKELSKN